METTTSKGKHIAKNTLVLYFRMLFLMLVSLYTSRVILDALGVQDYGIYNVVGGFVALFALISAALTSACSRFLNFEMGKADPERQNVVFSTALTIQWTLAIIVFVLAEVVGVWYVNNMMVLPSDRLTAANWCFQFSVFNFCMNLITVPYNASIIAHERMKAFAYVSIYEGLAKLGISYLVYFDPFDRLVFYALMLLIVQFTVRYAYQYYCRRHFEECHYKRVFDKPLLKKMLSYSVWHLIGNGATVLKNQGVNVLLNLFFGPTVNAARGVAMQVNNAITQFTHNFMIAMNPQITQSYAKGDLKYMFNLVYRGSRFSFYLLLLLSLPVIINIHYVLGIWLKTVPEHTAIFQNLTIIAAMITSLSNPLITAQNATGNVRNYQEVVGGIMLLNLPFSYLCLKLGFAAESVFVVAILVEIACLAIRFIMIPFTIKEFRPVDFIKKVIVNCIFVCITAIPVPLLLHIIMPENFFSFLANVIVTLLSTSLAIYFIGCQSEERTLIQSRVVGAYNKFIKSS